MVAVGFQIMFPVVIVPLSDMAVIEYVSYYRIWFRFSVYGSDCFRITVPVSQYLDYNSGFSFLSGLGFLVSGVF
jgi:hypothetical protein